MCFPSYIYVFVFNSIVLCKQRSSASGAGSCLCGSGGKNFDVVFLSSGNFHIHVPSSDESYFIFEPLWWLRMLYSAEAICSCLLRCPATLLFYLLRD